ncbi:hypothetical protein HYT32_01955 [Candidatus Roizmanbacteria bacterium]|nr:hypothetical protein [Candidatus Roizmanbacteria bacterium]
MKILIGTPIHQIKDYAIEKWLKNVSDLILEYPADLLLMDNSPGLSYVEKVKEYCKKYAIKKYQIEHFEINTKQLTSSEARSLRVEISQEMIRRKTLKEGYDGWFSWECDQIIPTNTLSEMVRLMKAENYMMVVANSWARTDPSHLNANMGVTLISKEGLEKAWFLPERDGKISQDLADSYNADETMFKKRILKSGGNFVEIYGVIKPIYHLNK